MMEKDILFKWKQQENRSGNIHIDKMDIKIKAITKDKEGHYIMVKGPIEEGNITLINMYAPNTGAPKYIKQILTEIKGEIDNNIIIVKNSNTPLTSMDRSFREKIKKATVVSNATIDQLDLMDIYRTFHPKSAEYTFFSNAHGKCSRIDHMLEHKTSLEKFKKIEIISSIFFPNHNSMKLKIMKAKQHATKKTNGSVKKSKKNQKIP